MKKKELTEEMFLDWWLEKYHNTSIKKIQEEHPEWNDKNPDYNSRIFYETYPCTQAQHDEWYKWAIDTVAKHLRCSKKYAKRQFCFVYLNTAPNVKESAKD